MRGTQGWELSYVYPGIQDDVRQMRGVLRMFMNSPQVIMKTVRCIICYLLEKDTHGEYNYVYLLFDTMKWKISEVYQYCALHPPKKVTLLTMKWFFQLSHFPVVGFFCCYITCRWIILWRSVSLLFGRYSFGSWKWTTFNNKSGWTWRDINLQLQKWPCKWHNLSFWM